MLWSAKNSVAIFSFQSLLLGTNVPNDIYIYIHIYIAVNIGTVESSLLETQKKTQTQ